VLLLVPFAVDNVFRVTAMLLEECEAFHNGLLYNLAIKWISSAFVGADSRGAYCIPIRSIFSTPELCYGSPLSVLSLDRKPATSLHPRRTTAIHLSDSRERDSQCIRVLRGVGASSWLDYILN
jgi:hypothetical protein